MGNVLGGEGNCTAGECPRGKCHTVQRANQWTYELQETCLIEKLVDKRWPHAVVVRSATDWRGSDGRNCVELEANTQQIGDGGRQLDGITVELRRVVASGRGGDGCSPGRGGGGSPPVSLRRHHHVTPYLPTSRPTFSHRLPPDHERKLLKLEQYWRSKNMAHAADVTLDSRR